MAAASRAASLSWAPSNPHTRGRRGVFSRAASMAHGLRRGEIFGSRVHREGSLCFIGALPKPVRKVSIFSRRLSLLVCVVKPRKTYVKCSYGQRADIDIPYSLAIAKR